MSGRERDLDRELSFHIEEHAADLMKRGVAREEAYRRARIALGGVEQVREDCRDERPTRHLERLTRDLRYALRSLRKNPASVLAIVLTVAVCVALNTAVFTVVDSLLLRPLPFDRADRLVSMTNRYPKAGVTDQAQSASGDYVDRQGTISALAEHALYRFIDEPLDLGAAPIQLRGMAVTPSFFPLLRVRPAQGRLFTESEGEPGRNLVVILTDSLSREAFAGADPIGRQLRLSGRTYTVAGVLPPEFRFISPQYRYFVPIALSPEDRKAHHNNNFNYIARLRDGATVAQAQAQVDALNAQQLEQLPQFKQLLIDAGFHTPVREFQPWLMRRVRPSLELLWAGALLVLLLGAVNLAGLSLARASARVRESATRLALGATKGDLARLCLMENILPTFLGGILGMTGGIFVLRLFNHQLLPGTSEIRPDPLVFAYALSGALFAGILAGLASLIPFQNLGLARAMYDGGRGGTARSHKLRRALVAAQIGLAFLLLNGAGVLTASLRELMKVHPGFQVNNVYTGSTLLPGAEYSQESTRLSAMDRILSGARTIPGVEIAAAASAVPFASQYDDNVIFAEGYTMKPGESAISPVRLQVTPGYFDAMTIPVVYGRALDERDKADGQRVVVIDERLANRFWPGENPVGRRMYYPGDPASKGMTVIGVVRSIRLENLAGTGNPNGVYYIPYAQSPTRAFTLVWRGNSQTATAMRSAFQQAVPSAALFDVRSMEERQELTLAPRRVAQSLVIVFAAVAVLLSGIGIYGLLAFLLTQRRREVGIRVAMGCRPTGVFNLFLRDGLTLAALGLAAGLGVAAAAKPWIAAQLYGVSAIEPIVIIIVIALLAFVAIAAICVPAWRASRLDPVRVLGEN